MFDARPQLSSIASTLATVNQQVADLAEACSKDSNSDLAVELFEVERALMSGLRRLERAAQRN